MLAAKLSISLGISTFFRFRRSTVAGARSSWSRCCAASRSTPKRKLVHVGGFAALIALMLLVSYHDIVRLVAGKGRYGPKERRVIRLRRKSKPVFLKNKTDVSDAKGVWIGGDHPIAVQSMTTTDTANVDATLEQIYGLAMAGCEIVRVTCQDPRDAAGLSAIVNRSPVPIVADVHFDHRMALAAIEAGVAKLRLNPGNITDPAKTREVVKLAVERGTPIRVGVNLGSLAKDLEERLGLTPEAMVESARPAHRNPRRPRPHRHCDLAQSA